ncbi:MAG: hypothetical protein IJY04_03840 [Clostridia bacterium]|nr:hypothetical protein [Clostridia bacterium]
MKILFIGNSYTYFNDLPGLVEKLAEENGINTQALSVTKGGWRIWQYLDNGDEHTEKMEKTLSENTFDAVILQDQSLIALKDNEKFTDGISRMNQKLNDKSDRVILYQTWGRKQGSPVLEENSWSYDEMANGITSAYRNLAKQLEIELSPVGECFYLVNGEHPEIELYNDDKSHPSPLGSRLAAIVHYRTLFGVLPKSYASLELSMDTLKIFTEAANRIFVS